MNENKVNEPNCENYYKIGSVEGMLNDSNSMIYNITPISLTDITYNIKNIPQTVRKYSNPKFTKSGSVSSRARLKRLKYQ